MYLETVMIVRDAQYTPNIFVWFHFTVRDNCNNLLAGCFLSSSVKKQGMIWQHKNMRSVQTYVTEWILQLLVDGYILNFFIDDHCENIQPCTICLWLKKTGVIDTLILETVKLIHSVRTPLCNILVCTFKIIIYGCKSVKTLQSISQIQNHCECWRSPFPVNATVISWIYPSALSNFIQPPFYPPLL